MSENEKTFSAENVAPETSGKEVTLPADACAAAGTNECKETESPAEAISEATDRIEGEATADGAAAEACSDECKETESPAEAISEATDRIEGEAEAEGTETASPADALRRYHSMTKEELIESLRNIVEEKNASAHKEVAAIKQSFYSIRNREIDEECIAYIEAGNSPESFSSTPDPLEAELKTLLAQFKELRSSFLEAEEAGRIENLELKRKIIAQLRGIVDDIDNINLHFPKFQQLQTEFKQIQDIPASAVAETWRDYQLAVEQFYDRLKMNKELRDLDFKKNLELKRELIEKAKELAEVPDVVSAFRQLQELHEKWREIGPVQKDLREEIWDEFKAASTVVNKRHQEFFETRKANEKAAEEAKTALCEKIEAVDLDAINSFSAWDEATKEIIAMQAEWKKLGFASRKVNNQLFARFRKACDDFFNRKSEYFRKTREEYAAALARKTALCEKIEALREINADDPSKAIDEVVKLQAEWKKAGTVPRKNSDDLWKRFSENCNFFFDQRKKELAAQRKEENANLAVKRDIIAKLREIPEDTERADAVATIRGLQAQWQATGRVPYKQKDKIYAEYREALDKLFSNFDIRESRARLSNFQNRIESADNSKLGRERERIIRVLEAKRNDLRTYENNLGFFNVKSSSGNSMLKEMERKIERLKAEIKETQEQLRMLDEKTK